MISWVHTKTLHLHSNACCAGKIRGLRDLITELSTVTQWYLLGIYLGLHLSTLEAIKRGCTDIIECLTQTLVKWQNKVTPTWSVVVKALVGIGRERLALHLATKYGMLNLASYPGSLS